MSRLDVREIKDLLQGLCPGLVHELVPLARPQGRGFFAPNPTRGGRDSRTSFYIRANGNWNEYDSGESGDILNLIAYVAGLDPKSLDGRRYAVQWAKNRLGIDDATPHARAEAVEKARRDAAERRRRAEEAAAKREAFVSQRVAAILADTQPLEPGGIVSRYLLGRGLDLSAIAHPAPALAFHPRLKHWACDDLHLGPAMVAAVHVGAQRPAVHCTFLEERDGAVTKARLPNPKLMLGPVRGGVVPISLGPSGRRLNDVAAAGEADDVILAEGIETSIAIAIAMPECRVWACLSLGGIGFAPIAHPGINRVIVALENDVSEQALRQRAQTLDRLAMAGKPLALASPHFGSDFADVMAAKGRERTGG